MATVHTEYGPGRIIDRETVRGRTRYKVAGDGFEVWVDQTRLGGLAPGDDYDVDYDEPGTGGAYGGEPPYYPGEDDPAALYRLRSRADEDGYGGYSDDDPAHYSSLRHAGWDTDDDEFGGDPRGRVDDIHDLRRRLDADDEMSDDDPARYSSRVMRGKDERLAWAPLDRDNSTELPYNPDPQYRAIGTPGDDGSSTIQPIHNIDSDERLTPSDSISFDEGEDDGAPGPNPDLFAREGGLHREAGAPPMWVINQAIQHFRDKYPEKAEQVESWVHDTFGISPENFKKMQQVAGDAATGATVGGAASMVDNQASQVVNWASPGGPQGGYGDLIHNASIHEAGPEVLLPLVAPALRALAPTAITHLLGGGGDDSSGGGDPFDGGADFGPGAGYGDMIQAQASYRPAGLSDKFIDLTAAMDPTDPVSMFRHDPDAYINRVGHLAGENLNPRFAEYMDLVEGDSSIRTAAWKDVRKKAMRLKREGNVTVKDIGPNRIMASVVGDHGTYDVVILKNGSFGGLSEGNPGHAISNWHCGCEWGKWAFRRKYTYVGRLCSHAYASYLTMQSEHMKGKPRQQKLPKRKAPSRALPFPSQMRHHADNLQNGPKRLTPEMIVNDADDAHMFVDVTKDERDDVGPDDVVSEKDIVHFAKVMRHCEVTESPYPRELVAFLSRYADCAGGGDDTQADWKAQDGSGAGEYINKLRDLADSDQSDDFGNMADRVHAIQHTVEEAREHGVDASQFVAMARQIVADGKNKWTTTQDGDRQLSRQDGNNWGWMRTPDGSLQQIEYTGRGSQGPEGNRYEIHNDSTPFAVSQDNGRTMVRSDGGKGDFGFGVSNTGDVMGAEYTGNGSLGDKQHWKPNGNFPQRQEWNNLQQYLKDNPNFNGGPTPAKPTTTTNTGDVPVGVEFNNGADSGVPAGVDFSGGTKPIPGTGGKNNQNGGQAGKGGGQTSGTVSDGGRAGAENGDNSAITKNMLDADGNYTVKGGETWTDIAQRTTGDMNNYQKMYDKNKGVAGPNVDNLAAGTKVNLKDFANDVGNNGVSGDVTNPKGSTSAQSGPAAPKPGGSATFNTETKTTTPTQTQRPAHVRRAQAPSGGTTNNSGQQNQTDTTAPLAAEAGGTNSPGAAPATNPATGKPSSAGGSNANSTAAPAPGTEQVQPTRSDDTLDKNNPAQMNEQQQARPGQQPATMPAVGTGAMSGTGSNDFGSAMDMIGTGVNAGADLVSGIGGALPGLASGLGSALSIFSSKQDFDEWARYAYPTADGEGDLEPHTHPFAGSGYPGSLEIGTSEEYADEMRPKMDDVTDLEQHDVEASMGKWQRQSARDDEWHDEDFYNDNEAYQNTSKERLEDERAFREQMKREKNASYDEATDDNSDIVRAFQANLSETALGAGAGGGSGRFDDISGAAAGFLRTAGRNYSLAEQSELIREGDKGGARNLDSLDLRGTHYEDMTTLGW